MERRRLDHLGQEADVQHGGGVDAVGGQEQALGGVQAEPRHVARHAAAIEVQAQAGGRHEHIAAGHADAEVAREAEIGGAAVDAAVDGGDGDRAGGLDDVHDFAEVQRTFVRLAGQRADVVAAAEILAGADEAEHQHARHLVDRLDMIPYGA
ncbi:hypothetical protein D3C81_1774700 [compost metagenome]